MQSTPPSLNSPPPPPPPPLLPLPLPPPQPNESPFLKQRCSLSLLGAATIDNKTQS